MSGPKNEVAHWTTKLTKKLQEEVNRALVNQTQDLSQKLAERMTTAFTVYTEEFVAPAIARVDEIEKREARAADLARCLWERIEYLELPWYRKLGMWLHGRWNVLRLHAAAIYARWETHESL